MRLIIASALLAACVHHVPLTPQERCGARGMVADRAASGDAGPGPTAYVLASSSDGMQCHRPANPVEQCEALGDAVGAAVKTKWDPRWRNALIFVGYAVLVVPGVVLSVGFIGAEENVYVQAYLDEFAVRSNCPR